MKKHMKKLFILIAASAFAMGCGAQKEEPAPDSPEESAPAAAPSAEPACDGAEATEEMCVCPDDYKGEPACPHAGEGKPCDCKNCPEGCECKGGDAPCPMKAAVQASPPS